MFKKNYLFLLLIILGIVTTYYFLNPLGDGKPSLESQEYKFTTENISSDNNSASFRLIDKKKSKFFIHPGIKKPTIVTFTFTKNNELLLYFSIDKGSKVGDIEFTIEHNDKNINKFVVTAKNPKIIKLKVSKKDNIKIIADKHGDTSADWGNLEIKSIDSVYLLKKFLIPFLWSILFIFLFGKQHIYIAMNSYIAFILILIAEKLNFGVLSFENILIYMLFIFALTFMFTLIYQELTQLKKFKIATLFSSVVTILIYTIPLFFIIYDLNFEQKITKNILFAVLQSNPTESYAFISDFISIKYIALFLLITAITGTLLYRQEQKEIYKVEKSLLLFIIITFFSISITQFSHLRLPKFLFEGFETYKQELHFFKQVQEKRKTGKIIFNAEKKEEGETYVFIIGESLHKKHMGLYGYLRNTTPNLSKMDNNGELTLFHNVYSNHTFTLRVLSLALTEANQYNNKNYYDSLSIIDILKKANIDTYWITNQELYSSWDSMISVIGTSADHVVAINKRIGEQVKTDNYDGALIDKVKNILSQQSTKTRVLFVHLMGSHFSYRYRYPHKEFTKYSQQLNPGEYGILASKNERINRYDNSVYYNDYVVSSILEDLQKLHGVSAFLYMPDHTDDVIGRRGHRASAFSYEMTQIPMIAWFSKSYKEKYLQKYKTFIGHTNTLFSNDMFYDTVIGLCNVHTDRYNAKYDLTSKQYSLNPQDATTLHGKKHYTAKDNYIYWQKYNIEYLKDHNQSSRVFPSTVNTIGKLHDIWNDGARSLQLDVNYMNKSKQLTLALKNQITDISLKKYFDTVDYSKIQKVILNINNLNKENTIAILERLEYLNNLYHLKQKTILVVNDTFFNNQYNTMGWKTSYMLPTDKIIKLIQSKNTIQISQFGNILKQQIEEKNIFEISFSSEVYDFVKVHLEPLLDARVNYNIISQSSLSEFNFVEKLNNKIYLDPKVKSLLFEYHSQFYL